MSYDAAEHWSKHYSNKSEYSKTYPHEGAVRMFMGSYPNLSLDKNYPGKRICDLSCGDGRNLVLFHDLGFDVVATEISQVIADKTKARLKNVEGIDCTILIGKSDDLPLEDNSLDYLFSWGSSYYMGSQEDFGVYVEEYARVLAPGGLFLAALPQPTHPVFTGSKQIRPGYQLICDDPVGIRNGEVLRMFADTSEIEDAFSSHFQDFRFGSLIDNCFGAQDDFFLVVCEKK